MVYQQPREAMRTITFRAQIIWTMLINFGINFGFEWAAVSKWGKYKHHSEFPEIYVWRWNPTLNSNMFLDLSLTAFLLASLCMLLATGGVQKDIKEGKCHPVSANMTVGGIWRFTPVRIRNIFLRSLAMGIWAWALFGLPTLGLLAVILRGGAMSGVGYSAFKGVWAFAVACPVFFVVFFSAADERNFPSLEFDRLMQERGREEAPPVVAQVGKV